MNNVDRSNLATRRYFWTTIVLAATAGTFLPILCGWGYRCDVLEQIFIGRLWVPGSFKHPALTTWIVELFRLATNGADFAPYLASNVCVAATIWCVWRLARSFMSESSALFAGLSVYLVYFFSSDNHLFNNNTTLCCFWAATLLAFHTALLKNKARYWILASVLLGCAFLSKYTAIILTASIILYLTTNRKARAYWKTPGPYLAAGATLAVFSVNLGFLFAHFEQLSRYSQGGCVPLAEFPWKFLRGWLKQIPIVAPVFIAFAPLIDWRRLTKEGPRSFRRPSENGACERAFDDGFLAKMFLYPILVQTIVQVATLLPLRWSGYASQFWPILGAVALAYFPQIRNDPARPDDRREERGALWTRRLVSIGIVCFFATIPLHMLICVYASDKPSGRYFDGQGLAEKIDDAWSERFDVPPRYVAGDFGRPLYMTWQYSVLSRFEPTLDAPELGPWASDDDVAREGGVLIWRVQSADDETRVPDLWKERFPTARFVETFDVRHRQKSPNIPPTRVGIAFVAPPNGAK